MSASNFSRRRTSAAGLLRLGGVLVLLVGLAAFNFSRWGVAPPSIVDARHEARLSDASRLLRALRRPGLHMIDDPLGVADEDEKRREYALPSPEIEDPPLTDSVAKTQNPAKEVDGAPSSLVDTLPTRRPTNASAEFHQVLPDYFKKGSPLPHIGSLIEPAQYEQCAMEHFGPGFLERWRKTGKEYCHGDRSTFIVHDIMQDQREQTSQFATFENGVLARGNVYIECHANTKQLSVWHSILQAASWKAQIYFDPSPAPLGPGFKDSASVTLLVVRDCNPPYNPFHCFTDLIATMFVLEMYHLKYNDTRIVFIDRQPQGNFWELWKSLSPNLYWHHDWEQWPQGVALPRGIFVPISQTSLSWKDFWKPTDCPYVNPIMFHMRQRFLEYLYSNFELPYEKFPCKKPYRITFPARIKNLNRHIANRGELMDAIRKEFPQACLVEVDFVTLTFIEQLALLRRTDVLLGMHGAAFQMMLFLKPTAELVEMHPQNSWARCFENQARWLGIPYHGWNEPGPMPNPQQSRVDASAIVNILGKILPADAKVPAR